MTLFQRSPSPSSSRSRPALIAETGRELDITAANLTLCTIGRQEGHVLSIHKLEHFALAARGQQNTQKDVDSRAGKHSLECSIRNGNCWVSDFTADVGTSHDASNSREKDTKNMNEVFVPLCSESVFLVQWVHDRPQAGPKLSMKVSEEMPMKPISGMGSRKSAMMTDKMQTTNNTKRPIWICYASGSVEACQCVMCGTLTTQSTPMRT